MKIRNRSLLRAAGFLGTVGAKALFRSLRFRLHTLGPEVRPQTAAEGERYIYCIWHENLLLPTLTLGCPTIAVLISKHADGQLLGSLIRSMGMGMVEGSSSSGSKNRGGIEAVRKLTRADNPWLHLAVTPDGPRGPRRVVKAGIVYIASRTGMKIVPFGVGYRDPWRLRSWDRFALPKPFTRAGCVVAEPIAVPHDARSAELERYRLLVQAEMDRLADSAEGWATTGRLSPSSAGRERALTGRTS